MLLYFSIAFAGLFYYTLRLWVLDGAKIPLVFLGLWILGLVGIPALGLGVHVFMGYQAVLALTLAIINGYRVPPLD